MPRWDEKRQVWRISAELGVVNGKRKRAVQNFKAPHTAAGRRQAINAEIKHRAATLAKLEARTPGSTADAGTFAKVAHDWIERNRYTWSPKTVAEREGALRREILPALGETRLEDVTPVQIETLYAQWQARFSPSTIRGWHSLIRTIFRDAERLDILTGRNPMRRVKTPGGRSPERTPPLPADIWTVVKAAASPAVATYVELAAATGIRRGSLVALRWRDIDLDTGRLTIAHAVTIGPDGKPVLKGTKADRPYVVTIAGPTLVTLRKHHTRAAETALSLGLKRLEDLFVFSRDGGRTHWNPHYPSHAWLRACRKAGLRPPPTKGATTAKRDTSGIRLHDLRHFTASRLLNESLSLRAVADRLGCTEANVIRTYSHHVPSAQDAYAAQIMADVLEADVS